MELRQLEMFLAVGESGGYTSAAERLHISHSAIHRQVRLLEHELKDRLLVRHNSHMKLTRTGKIVLKQGRDILQAVANLQRQVDDVAQLQSGYLRIGTGTMMLRFFLAPVIKHFRQAFPGIDLRMITGTTDQVIEGIEAGELDLGIIFSPVDDPKELNAFLYEPLYREEFVWAVSKANPLANRKDVPLAQILEYPIITYPKASYVRRVFEQLVAKAQLEPKMIMELESEESMEKMLDIYMGIALLARRHVLTDNIHFVRTPEGSIYCDVGAISPRADYTPGVVKEFARTCREASLLEARGSLGVCHTLSSIPPGLVAGFLQQTPAKARDAAVL
jgi:DNA-binding transcriptional LysR family regulator